VRRHRALGIISAAIGVCLALLCLELAVRLHRGRAPHVQFPTIRPMTYDSGLGWVPTPGQVSMGTWTSNSDAASIRHNGRSAATIGRPILAVGDSFTFGDEVEDGETWVARLEEILDKRVINAGVGAYGIDQAFLRAELLLDQYEPDVVLLSFVSEDITRTEYAYYPYGRGWKPYFTYENGALTLRNVPVPQGPAPASSRPLQPLRRALEYSLLADAVFDRIARRWWRDLPVVRRIHRDGEQVSIDLLARLDAFTKARRGRFIAIALATNGRIGDNARLPSLVTRARARGITILDLSTETLRLRPNQLQDLFLPGGHYSPAMNRAVAERIAAFLQGPLGVLDPPARSRGDPPELARPFSAFEHDLDPK